jgi:hypothetical protein
MPEGIKRFKAAHARCFDLKPADRIGARDEVGQPLNGRPQCGYPKLSAEYEFQIIADAARRYLGELNVAS